MSGSLDTNILLRLIVGDITHQTLLASKLFEKATRPLFVADIVFLEMEYALTTNYKLNRVDVVALLESLVTNPSIACNREMLKDAMRRYIKHPALSLTDIMLSLYAGQNDSNPLWTFDKKLASQLPNTKLLN